MSGTLFISGGGRAIDSSLLDREFVRSLKTGKILYIPVGLQRSFLGYEECYDWISKTLGAHSPLVDLDITMWVSLKNKTHDNLNIFDAIYIGGAKEASDLMSIIRRANFTKPLTAYYENGGSIYGGSAGALILGHRIMPYAKIIDHQTKIMFGMSLLNKYSLYCHYDKDQNKFIESFITRYKTPVVSLPENSGIILMGSKVQVSGFSPCIIFEPTGKKVFKPGTIFQI